ncbi:MAG: sulfatase-like hydrolase/transferase [Bacteroidaceae bacterium]|nr:sulfatase-like hydrolase/transferase [Bacteroidaceae bacterium]
MKERIVALAKYYLTLLLIFVAEKPLFMLYQWVAGGAGQGDYGVKEWLQVVWHGLPVDRSTAGYITAFPLLLVLVGTWMGGRTMRKILRVYNLIIGIILAVIFLGDAVTYPFWGMKLDSSIFFYLQSPKDAFASAPWYMTLLGFAAAGVIGWLAYRVLEWSVNDNAFSACGRRVSASALLVLLLGLLFLEIRGGVSQSTMNVGKAYFSQDQYLNHSAVNPAFSLLSSMGKEKDFDQMFNFFDQETLDEQLQGLFPKGGLLTDTLLNTDRPNVLLIIMEGFGADFIEELGGEPGVAPNIARLSNEGIFFTNCYAGSFRTDRGTVCVLNGHQGLPTESIMKMPSKSSTLNSIPARLADAGYSTSFLYGGDINFTNMQSYLWSNGYQTIESDRDFTAAERATGAWGVTDSIVFRRLLSELKAMPTDAPWHKAFLTLSSHEPFEVPFDRFEDKILNSFAYTDHCLGQLVDSLKQLPLWDNLLLIAVPDHGFCYQPTNRHYPHAHHIPMLWIGGAVSHPIRVDRMISQSDLAATLLAQMGLPHDDFPFSRNVFADNYDYPCSFYSFKNGFAFADSTGITLYDNDAEDVFYNESSAQGLIPASQDSASAHRLARGKAILQSLYDDLGRR